MPPLFCQFLGFPGGSDGRESACNVRDLGLIPGLGGSPGEGHSYPHQYSALENSMDCIVHAVPKSRTGLREFTLLLLYFWRRKRQPTPVFMPGKSHGPRSLVGYNPRGRKELDTTERLLCVCYFTFLSIYQQVALDSSCK